MNIKFHTLFTFSLILLAVFITPTKALAVPIQNLNGATGSTQTFQSDSNVTMSTNPATNNHTLGWFGQLPISRGGTGVGSFTAGSLLFYNGSTFAENNSKLFWDNTNNRLGIGTSSPTSNLGVVGNASITGDLDVTGNITGNVTATNLVPYIGATANVDLGTHNLTADRLASANDAIINSVTVGRGGRSLLTNTALGYNVLNSSSSSNHNTAIGYSALSSGSYNGEDNTAIGSHALDSSTTGSYNTALGFEALKVNTTGTRNVALGMQALGGSTTASSNIGIGFRSLNSTTIDGSNVAIGDSSGRWITTGISNVIIGTNTAFYQSDGSTDLTATNNSVYIGANVQGYDNNDNNSIVIGQAAIGAGANKTVIGNSSMTDVYFGSISANANTHSKKMFLGTSTTPGCIVMGDTAGGVGYITLTSGVLTVSTTPPSACQ